MKHFDLIERKLKGLLSSDELSAFNEKLLTDSKFAEEYELQQIENLILEVNMEMELKKEISQYRSRKNITDPKNLNRRPLISRFLFTLLFSACVAAFFHWWPSQSTMTNGEYASVYYKKYGPNFSGTKAVEIDVDSVALIQSYWYNDLTEEEFSRVEKQLLEISKGGTDYAKYLLAHFYLKRKNYLEANKYLDLYLNSAGDDWKENAQFYKVIALIGCNEKEKALNYLNEIIGNHTFSREMDIILISLERAK